MRIALVQPKFDRSGGAERYALGLAAGLAARGHEVHVFARRVEALPEGVRFHRIPSVPFGRALKTYSFWRLCERRVRRDRFDVVQGFGKTACQGVHRTGGGVHRAYLERRGIAGSTAYDRVVLRIEDRLFAAPHLRAVICPSRWVAGEVARFYPSAAGRVRVVPNGVDTARFAPERREADLQAVRHRFGVPADAPVLLFAATNFRLKGLDRAVAATGAVAGAHLVVVGGDDPAPFRAPAVEAGCADRVHFAGAQGDLAPWYRAADVLVHPTRYDPFANVCLEALSCGTPVVTTCSDGAADLVAPDPAAGRVTGGEPGEVAAAVQAVLAAGSGARAAARALAQGHDLVAHVAAVEAVYRDVTGAGP